MTQSNVAMFGRNSARLLKRFEEELDIILHDRRNCADRVETLRRDRKSRVDSLVNELLPDLDPVSLELLAQALPEFVSRPIQQKIDAYQTLQVPFWTWVFGGGDAYRTDAETKLLEILRTRLRGHIDTVDPRPEFLTDLSDIDTLILEFESRDIELARSAGELHKQINVLTLARRSEKVVPTRLATAVAKSIAKAMDTPKGVPHTAGDGASFFDLFVLQSLLDQTFVFSPSGDVSYQPAFTGGGGGFGGAGSTASFEAPAPVPVEGPAEVTATDAVFTDESVAGLGSIS